MAKIICGVEEAGRGPVIGPMVMAACTIKEEDELNLKVLGVKDSKLLSPLQRERLYREIVKSVIEYRIIIIPPKQIDEALEDKRLNLNWLEANITAEFINALKPDKAILDCPSNNIKAYSEYVRERVKGGVEILAEHKADLNHPIVSAASILAKVTRDKEIEKIKEKVGVNFGSGYPADPITAEFLEKNYDKHPEIFRKSWTSYKAVANKKKQKKLFDF